MPRKPEDVPEQQKEDTARGREQQAAERYVDELIARFGIAALYTGNNNKFETREQLRARLRRLWGWCDEREQSKPRS